MSEPALTASRRCPESASASAPWDPSAVPVPSPPVSKLANGVRWSLWARNAKIALPPWAAVASFSVYRTAGW